MPVITLCVFAAIAVFHLLMILMGQQRLKECSKVLLMPALMVYYYFSAKLLPYAVMGMLLGWLGDVLLLKKSWFLPGLVCFLLGHVCYILSFLVWSGGTGTWFPVGILFPVVFILAFGLGFLVYRLIQPSPTLRIPVILYTVVIETMSICAFALMRSHPGWPGIVIFGGSLCFLLSDTALAYGVFRRVPKYGSFFVMLTYILAQLGIVLGLAA
jgi:uncharacterized membrane protein YhhN